MSSDKSTKMKCGIIMPISELDGCPASHWLEVQEIVSESITSAGFEPNLVSSDSDIGVIQKRIVQNIYDNPIVVCDISGKNANVMFELGMRLAFDKPVVIIKDDKTPYSFDTSPLEHLGYPRDLRFGAIRQFKELLSKKIESSLGNKNSFLKSFGSFKIAEIKEENVSAVELIMDEVSDIKSALIKILSEQDRNRRVRDHMEHSLIEASRRKAGTNALAGIYDKNFLEESKEENLADSLNWGAKK